MKDKYEVIKFEDGEFSLDVSVDPGEDTVWLTQAQMAILFEKDRKTITRHIQNIFKDEELLEKQVCSLFEHTANDGKKYNVKYYNLDMIIAIGYRVNSKRGIAFRHWATSVLKQYMLRGYSINNQRCLDCQSSIISLERKVEQLTNDVHRLDIPEKLVYENELLDAYTFIRKLFFLAKREIVIIDNYADMFILDMLKDIKVKITIITSLSSYLNKVDITSNIHIYNTDIFHDRYIIIDKIVYALGTSFNDIGKKRFTIMKVNDITKDMLLKGCDIYE